MITPYALLSLHKLLEIFVFPIEKFYLALITVTAEQ